MTFNDIVSRPLSAATTSKALVSTPRSSEEHVAVESPTVIGCVSDTVTAHDDTTPPRYGACLSDASSPLKRPSPAAAAVQSRLPSGRKLDAAWSFVDVDPEGGVWCQTCSRLIQSTGCKHVERVKYHLNSWYAYRAVGGRITDTYRPKMKSDVLFRF